MPTSHNSSPSSTEVSSLGPLEIGVTASDGVHIFDANSILGACLNGQVEAMEPIAGVVSELSGAPAVTYETREVKLALAVAEVVRLTTRSLSPDEYSLLHRKHGDFFEIHDGFYDEASGLAFMPKH